MKLLILTQVVDRNHPVLGFFHRWILEFADQCESVEVIALSVGDFDVPKNVRVHSLGKEAGVGRHVYLWRFYKLIWSLRHEYDNVFVHMTQLYVILGGAVWRCLGKKIGLWYAHGSVSRSLRLATRLTHTVFTSTPEGFRLPSPKCVIVGQGIDMDLFTTAHRTLPVVPEFITDGRISPAKNIDTLLRACALLKQSGQPFRFRIVGAPLTSSETEYQEKLVALITELDVCDEVIWEGGVTQTKLAQLLLTADIYIQNGATDSLDKALVQAVATGLPTVSSNQAFATLAAIYAPGNTFPSQNHTILAEKIRMLLAQTDAGRVEIMEPFTTYIRSEYGIEQLMSRIVFKYNTAD